MSEFELSDFSKKKKKPKKTETVKSSGKKKVVSVKKTKASVKKTKTTKTDVPEKKSKKKPLDKKGKKRKIKTELASVPDSALDREGLLVIENLSESVFDKNREQAEQYSEMFYNLIKIRKIAERKYYKSKNSRDIYALVKIYDQMREVIADMKALQDVGDYIHQLDEEVLRPFALQAAQALVELVSKTRQYSAKTASSDIHAEIETFMKRQAKHSGVVLNDSYRSALDNATKILLG